MRRKFSCDRGTTVTRLEDLLQDLAVRAPPRPPRKTPRPRGDPHSDPQTPGGSPKMPRVTLLHDLAARANGTPGGPPKWNPPRVLRVTPPGWPQPHGNPRVTPPAG